MKKTRTEKGITLIALILTIVTLLILASVAISSIQNDGILSYTENVANKYNQSQRDEQSVLDQYLGYLKGDNEWITIYEGQGVTEDGELLLANKHLFKDGNFYRITVKSDEFTGTVETTAVLYQAASGNELYILFGVSDAKAVTANSLAEYMTILENLGEEAVFTSVAGVNVTQGEENSSYIMFDGNTCEYKVIKIEEKEGEPRDPSLIFEGMCTVEANGTEIIGSKSPLSLNRKYRLDLMVNGEKTTVYSMTLMFLELPILGCDIGESVGIFFGENNGTNWVQKASSMADTTVIITAIYDDGPSDTYVEENGFVVVGNYRGNNYWNLIATPDTEYIVPETVGGKTINNIYLDCISGVPTFVRDVESIYLADRVTTNKEYKIISNDVTVVNSLVLKISNCTQNSSIYLTECSDNFTFSDEFLALTTNSNTIYVTAAVKAKYPDNTNIVAQ